MDHGSDIERTSADGKADSSVRADAADQPVQKQPLKHRIAAIVWDSLDKTPEERKFVAKIDWYILSYCCISYFCKYLDQTNVGYPALRPGLIVVRLSNIDTDLRAPSRSAMHTFRE